MEWIKCEERMPEHYTDVLVYCPEYPDECFIATYLNPSRVYNRPRFYDMLNDMYYEVSRITHWCPLPELPKTRK